MYIDTSTSCSFPSIFGIVFAPMALCRLRCLCWALASRRRCWAGRCLAFDMAGFESIYEALIGSNMALCLSFL
ncbi:hypothetical protein PDIG_33420 [Penicillium digitatum PHI26]|uniref:Uncharacterized protein n=2 Tax=Penicillium digitatum TaxID=36651 RepID=K9GMC5_PEND2|nr:hypothetical protein PDIP_53000 [Penicillium digitatum Pd1]EKV12153.1 hypothetical protein PDIP_53000 [Penicillium digitatum Pd1]EKV14326.1 hypothetical protein PDIG_33420 [Penicillium digitatum PHI26]